MKEYSHGSRQKITLSSTPSVASFSCTMNHYTMVQRVGTKKTVIFSPEVMTLTPLTLDGFLQDSFLFLLPYQESDPVGESGGSTCHSHPHPPPPPPKIIIIGIHYNTRRLQVINQHKYLETEFCIIHDVPIHCLSPLYDPN